MGVTAPGAAQGLGVQLAVAGFLGDLVCDALPGRAVRSREKNGVHSIA